ncbi:DUF2207 domain-containing protein [Alkalicoccus urumqiensis]|uniref:DUF2207 domain-containing protein n=1 Tax=Alkalicoccus urumqiensis TaxID=1548213 RepID=A0A2P6MDV4_ALKUR|nr:DUF2207 domain-containing protein [Alkalicoccus urumqiensis]PRO64444.1 hypothetical protein C6I21_14690 [Alkalicoccus urumqiensis]
MLNMIIGVVLAAVIWLLISLWLFHRRPAEAQSSIRVSPAVCGSLAGRTMSASQMTAVFMYMLDMGWIRRVPLQTGAEYRKASAVPPLYPHEAYYLNWLTEKIGRNGSFTLEDIEDANASAGARSIHADRTLEWDRIVRQDLERMGLRKRSRRFVTAAVTIAALFTGAGPFFLFTAPAGALILWGGVAILFTGSFFFTKISSEGMLLKNQLLSESRELLEKPEEMFTLEDRMTAASLGIDRAVHPAGRFFQERPSFQGTMPVYAPPLAAAGAGAGASELSRLEQAFIQAETDTLWAADSISGDSAE